MFEGDKWARQSAILVLIHWSFVFACASLGIERFATAGIAWVAITLVIIAIHMSGRTEMFKGQNWEKDAKVTLIIFAILGLVGATNILALPFNLVVMHSVVWYIRKKTGGDKKPISPTDDVKIGSPF
jgi:hypothetical protein